MIRKTSPSRTITTFEFLESRQLFALPAHSVRVAYLIPANRSANPETIVGLRNAVTRISSFYADQMSRHGLTGAMPYETEADNTTPKITVLNVPQTDVFLRADDASNDGITMYSRINDAASAAGVQVFGSGQVWVLVAEMHVLGPDGTLVSGPFLGAGFGSGSGGGVAHFSSAIAPFFAESGLNDTRPYAGLTLPSIGGTPLVNQVSFPWFEGSTVGDVAGSQLGGLAHEIGHAVGLPHDYRNDQNFVGDLMGNGLRGIRGAAAPAHFANNATWLSRGHALQLSASRFLQPPRTFTDNTEPTLSIATSGTISPAADGRVRISFTAADPSGLVVANLSRNGDSVGELRLNSVTNFTGTIDTPYYDLGAAEYKITVLDSQGNKRDLAVNLTIAGIVNRAPKPFVTISNHTPLTGQTITLSASQSTDPESNAMQYQWDLDGDGLFDTPVSPSPTFGISFAAAGTRRIGLRVVDTAGGISVSSLVPIRVVADAVAPTLVATTFDFETGRRLSLTFNKDIGPTLDESELTLTNLTTGQTLGPGQYTLTRNGSGVSVRTSAILADGNWRASISAAAVSDALGNTNAALTGDFHVLAGDANRDRAVNFADLLILAQNFGQSNRPFSQGNFDYSPVGLIDFSDLLIMAQRFGTSLLSGPSISWPLAGKDARRRADLLASF